MTNPIVSICCLTYNHAPFISKALDGFLMQQPPSCVPQGAQMNDWCEILIHDDCSTDGTTEIIKEYAAKYPDLIFPLYEEVNQFSSGVKVDFLNYNRARGKYIAYCEGDDYWTDPSKLQKQVDFMDSHPEYSICMHGCSVYDTRTKKKYVSRDFSRYAQTSNKREDGVDFTAKDYFEGYFGQPLTMVFRLSMFDFGWHKRYKYYRDTHEIYHLLKAGKGYWMNFQGGIYNRHGGGVAASITTDRQYEVSYVISSELYEQNKDEITKWYYLKTLQWLIAKQASIHGISRLSLIWKYCRVSGRLSKLKYLFK